MPQDLPRPEACRQAQSSLDWLGHFQHNAESWDDIPWENGAEITPAEVEAVAKSMQRFQLGESSEGRHLVAAAQKQAERDGDTSYVQALQLFIREEQRHASVLGRFLKRAGVRLLRTTWSDNVFRWLRHRGGLELSIVVLVTAEVIAKVYYAALRDATRSPLLRAICVRILAEEIDHVCFQTERLAQLRQNRGRLFVGVAQRLHRLFFAGTCLIVWWEHGKVFRAAGWSFPVFWRSARAEILEAVRWMDPRTHVAAGETQLKAGCG